MARPKKAKEVTIPDSVFSLEPIKKNKCGTAVYKDNPFITPDKFCVPVKDKYEILAGNLELTDKETEDSLGLGVVSKVKRVDTDQFVKLYSANIAQLFDLPGTAQRVMIAVILAMQDQAKDKSEIFLSYQASLEYYKSINYDKIPSMRIFSRGINILIEEKFLAAHWLGKGWYWINPNLIFNGSRVVFAEVYIDKRREERQHEHRKIFNSQNTSKEFDEEEFFNSLTPELQEAYIKKK